MVLKCQEVPVFHPTLRDINGSFEAYIESIERRFANVGLAKIIPPKGWTPRKQGYSDDFDFEIPRPIRQHATGKRGLYRTLLVEQKPMSLAKDFRPIAVGDDSLPPAKETPEEVERRFWRNITLRPPLYGADVPGSLFDADLKGWNLRHLDSLLSRTLEKKNLAIPGVSTPYLYFGMWRSIFAWHTEDMDLASVNYLHCGAPKAWYCIPPAHRERFERFLQGMLPDMFRACPEFFRHKELLVSPYMLLQNNIPVVRCVQRPGEFIINYPGAYHSGFNHGFNCAESTNFATKSWIAVGVNAGFCECQKDSVAIQMSLFMNEAAPRVRRMIREAEASSSEESGSDSDSDASSADSDSEADSVEDTSEDEEPAKPVKRKGKAGGKKPLVSGGRGMAAVVQPAGRNRVGAKEAAAGKRGRPAVKRGRPPTKAAAKAPSRPLKRAPAKATPAKAQSKQRSAVKTPPAKPQRAPRSTSRKPVGTVSRAVGKRSASLPARLLPMKGGGLKRADSAQNGAARSASGSRGKSSTVPAKRGRPPNKTPARMAGQKRLPVSAHTRSAQAGSAKRPRTESSAVRTPVRRHDSAAEEGAQQQRRELRPDAAKAAAAKRVVQRARQPSPRAGQGSMLGRMLTLTARAAEAAKGFLGGGAAGSRSGPANGQTVSAGSAVAPACSVRLVPKGSLCSSAPAKSCQADGSPRAQMLREVPRRPRSVRLGGRKVVLPKSELAASPLHRLQASRSGKLLVVQKAGVQRKAGRPRK
ncbi:g8028 [Coccomyxa elongata]